MSSSYSSPYNENPAGQGPLWVPQNPVNIRCVVDDRSLALTRQLSAEAGHLLYPSGATEDVDVLTGEIVFTVRHRGISTKERHSGGSPLVRSSLNGILVPDLALDYGGDHKKRDATRRAWIRDNLIPVGISLTDRRFEHHSGQQSSGWFTSQISGTVTLRALEPIDIFDPIEAAPASESEFALATQPGISGTKRLLYPRKWHRPARRIVDDKDFMPQLRALGEESTRRHKAAFEVNHFNVTPAKAKEAANGPPFPAGKLDQLGIDEKRHLFTIGWLERIFQRRAQILTAAGVMPALGAALDSSPASFAGVAFVTLDQNATRVGDLLSIPLPAPLLEAVYSDPSIQNDLEGLQSTIQAAYQSSFRNVIGTSLQPGAPREGVKIFIR